MGKATITAGGPDGSYTIDLDFGGAVRTAKIDKLAKFITDTQTSIEKEQVEADKDKTKEDAQQALVTSYLNSYVAMANSAAASGIPADPKAFNFELTKLIQMRAANAPRKLKLQQLKAAKAQAEKDRSYWQGLQLTETRQAWCVDFTEDAAGVVDTLDVPGESELILIAGGGAAPNDGGGQLTAREVQSPEQVFFNAAILPGWQKWRPTYRTGVITALYADDTADVKLDDAKSSAQGLSINQTSTLKAVPVQYMDCNADAFEVDDKVVIRFDGQSWDAPKVIGFVTNPKPCNPWQLAVAVTNSTFNTASLRFSCKDGDLISDMVANATTYTCDFSVGGSGWQPMTFHPVSALNPTIGEFKPGDKWSLPEIWFGEVESIGKCLGLDAQSNQYGGATMAFRVQKAGKTVAKFATKLDAALYSGTVAQYAGVGQARPPWSGSMPLEKFEFEFPD